MQGAAAALVLVAQAQEALAVEALVMGILAMSHQWLELMDLVAEVAVGGIQQPHIQLGQMVVMVLLSLEY
jgi:hypothetical protein